MQFLYNGLIYEARNLNRISAYRSNDEYQSTLSSESPLLDGDVVLVYHGIAFLSDVYKILGKGVDGSVVVPRKDAYENVENPRGLFVTPTLRTAEYFANSGYIIEFNVSVSDLESPIWQTDDEPIDNPVAREYIRNSWRKLHSGSQTNFVGKADRPELAKIFSRQVEPQALFVGMLRPNQIKAIWYNPSKDSTAPPESKDAWTRLPLSKALKQLAETLSWKSE